MLPRGYRPKPRLCLRCLRRPTTGPFSSPCRYRTFGNCGAPCAAFVAQPLGFSVHFLKQKSRSDSQFGPVTSGIGVGVTCWVPTVGGSVPVPRILTHKSNAVWQLFKHAFWTILFFEIGVRLPAKLVAIEQKRIIAAALSFICTLHKPVRTCRKPRATDRACRSDERR